MEKCLQPDPARRYRSAGELADDFSRFLEGLPVAARPITRLERTVKWARRRPVAALAAAVSVAFAFAAIGGTAYHVVELQRANEQISRSRDQAERNRDEAERNRDEAEAAISVAGRSMERLTGAAIKRMLLRGEALDAGDQEFLRQVADEFRNWPLGSDPVTALQFRLTGLRRIAGLFFDVGQYADSLACQQSELVVLDDLAERLPGDMQVLRNRLDAHYRMRFSLYHLHRADEAVASARESIRLLKAAPAELPQRDRDLADTTMYLAAFLSEQQRFDEAAPLFDESIAEVRQLRERLPDDISLAAQQLNILYSAQLCAYNAGRQDLRLDWLEQLVAAGEAAVKQFPPQPETPRFRTDLIKLLGIGLSQQVTLARDAGRLDEAAELAKRREQLAADFVATLPPAAIDPVHRELIDARIQLADILRQREQPAASDAALAEARGLADRLVAEQPAIWDHARLLGRVLHQQGPIAAAAGDAAAATAIFQQEIDLLTPWLEHAGRSNDAAIFIDAAKEAVASIDAAKTLAAD